MIFLWFGIVLLTLKLLGVQPVAEWGWLSIAVPFVCAVVWLEILEPTLGLDVKRQEAVMRNFEKRVNAFNKKKPRRTGRGSRLR